jgi:hypothetical protein
MAFLRAGIFGNLQLLARYFYPIAQTDLEGNTQAAEKIRAVSIEKSKRW